MAFSTETLTAVDEFVAGLNTKFEALTSYPRQGYTHGQERGRKFIKIWHEPTHDGEASCMNRSVYCFVDDEGNIFKPAGWKAPAKGVRGNLFQEGVGALVARTDPFGSWLYKHG